MASIFLKFEIGNLKFEINKSYITA